MSAVAGPDGKLRCPWGATDNELYRDYHDTEWGQPLHGRNELYERLCLEAFQSGLAWITILRKRESFRTAFAGFDPEHVARFDEADVDRLMNDASIVRNRLKIEAAVNNARAVVDLHDTDLDTLLWSFAPEPRPARLIEFSEVPASTEESTAMAKELKRRGLRFVGPTTAYALMQATGMVDDHLSECWVQVTNTDSVSRYRGR
ncbi:MULTISPECIES: DNA-3-methyladenine glycosylase I [unclassified Rhodococcus (in: high G+C Gram-positive bacteria)]|uniref:DNA-3-methyladenine glycosylase I n=1 Tax=unclassified Rhodococcus (in: high G+C Gram-positive bacteria) TaxID=192944 RepID=UPI0011EDA7AD|nr:MULTISPECIES: DNA-3-methyladenine glycosylase I [unclassified Rhodococcus (in: high G+C Gram-positive bacteria)]KAA0922446.1 DNA-3-methyladenine glycosylase I [Rhodococcus sp. ANT_H53B]MDI6627620.1 DNA-3-methyladenine glycosylase I [Rhodococcus sp. (in: high G+C Gram-positive bacteria)]MDI9928274.1 DNA-3-methyladenine glycosylase I [Rhodococcus sp. IEGM 1341]